MESIRFPTREFFPLFEVPSSNNHTTPFSSNPEKEVLLAIPYGKKTYLWMTNNGNDVCFSVPRNFKTQPEWTEVSTQISTQSPQPFYGTLLSGTFVYPPGNANATTNMEYFVADDIFYYAGISLSKSTFCERLEYLMTFFHQYIPIAPSAPPPNIRSSKKHIEIVIVNMRGRNDPPLKPNYRVHHWQLRNLSLVSPYYALSFEPGSNPNPNPNQGNVPTQQQNIPIATMTPAPAPAIQHTKKEHVQPPPTKKQWMFQYHLPAYKQKAIFKLVPEEQCDVYTIYARTRSEDSHQIQWVSCGYAGIFQYETSRLLNYHSRNITSNHLDQIEESDDEEETPRKSAPNLPIAPQYFECTFSSKFRKWVPVYFVPNCSPEKAIEMDKLAYYGENIPARSRPSPSATTYYPQPPVRNRHFKK